MTTTTERFDIWDVAAQAGVKDVIQDRVVNGTKFDIADFTVAPWAGELHAVVNEWVLAIPDRPTFDFLADMWRTARMNAAHVNMNASPIAYTTPGQAKGIGNCMLAELRRAANTSRPSSVTVTEPGIYLHDGTVFKVQKSKSSDRLYAKRLVPIGGTRLSVDDDRVRWEFEYANGAIFDLAAADRMDEDDARQFGIRYGICANCGRHLSDADSVARGIGPVCAKWFRF